MPLGVGFVGSGFNARFHMLGWQGVRDADVLGVWSPNKKNAQSAAEYARSLDVGACEAYRSITDMVADPAIEAIWLTGPNHARVENVEELVDAVKSGKGMLKGIAIEKPLARNVGEAKQILKLAESLGIPLGYLENQVFAPQVEHGRRRSTRGRTCPGSGRGRCRAAAC
jgi:predicted dehydrogenase